MLINHSLPAICPMDNVERMPCNAYMEEVDNFGGQC